MTCPPHPPECPTGDIYPSPHGLNSPHPLQIPRGGTCPSPPGDGGRFRFRFGAGPHARTHRPPGTCWPPWPRAWPGSARRSSLPAAPAALHRLPPPPPPPHAAPLGCFRLRFGRFRCRSGVSAASSGTSGITRAFPSPPCRFRHHLGHSRQHFEYLRRRSSISAPNSTLGHFRC